VLYGAHYSSHQHPPPLRGRMKVGGDTRGIEEKGWKWYYLIGGETV